MTQLDVLKERILKIQSEGYKIRFCDVAFAKLKPEFIEATNKLLDDVVMFDFRDKTTEAS